MTKKRLKLSKRDISRKMVDDIYLLDLTFKIPVPKAKCYSIFHYSVLQGVLGYWDGRIQKKVPDTYYYKKNVNLDD